MDPDDILKAAPVIAKGAGALAAAVPFTAIVKRMLGPAADELAEVLRDNVRMYRYGRSLDMLKKAEKMTMDAKIAPNAVPIKLLFPLLDGASFEDNEDLHTMWAALLANAASPEHSAHVRPGFIAILRQMAPDEAALLNWLYQSLASSSTHFGFLSLSISDAHVLGLEEQASATNNDIMTVDPIDECLGGLEAAQLIRTSLEATPTTFEIRRMGSRNASRHFLTSRGCQFIRACLPPKPKS